ncbi:hypothetical protein K504DRAFT_476060 [Pleomassaria siparia CBS 279.74]|uniref:Zn(2)-C6 fungal-type domain-containing protein n=1 Tax=Pleomassaria siparia CBS 279.74 TaxID=1314801 RepID=A0A6G1KAR1_9PLEO|nr:hypothetical protein K504DRAFT_476060 [Pleomassaria siparia CBS 279.74]
MSIPRRKACVECRQQKIRCDVEQVKKPHEPCTRCSKMKLECRILPTSTRNLRQTKAEMRRELEELKWNMRNDTNHVNSTPSSVIGTVDEVQSFPGYEPGPGTTISSTASGVNDSISPYENGPSRPSTRTGPGSQAHTLPRALNEYLVDAKKLQDCFSLFMTQYHPILPILDTALTPNDYYNLSPFLFWSIIVTGSRRYSDDPTILDRTSQLITPLAFSSMALRSTPIPVIQGLLILCTWRLPTYSMYKDMTHVLCGAAVHLATQIGLHIAGVGQDFARMPLKKDQDQKVLRAKLWMHCIIVSIRSSCAEGIPPLLIAEPPFAGDEREREEMALYLPADLLFLHKVHIVLLRAMSAMVRTDLKSPNCDANVLRSLISIFDSQLVGLAPCAKSELDTFQLNCARVHILAFHFFAHPTNPGPDLESLSRLYSLCVSIVQTANSMTQLSNFATVCPSFIDRTITLTGFAILKLARSPLAPHLDLNAGERAFFHAVQFSKAMSLQDNDLGARAATIMTNLWSSSKIFMRKNGLAESLGLRLRTRLSMSVSFDMFWYWREEFGHMSNPYNGEESTVPSNAHTQPTTPQYEKEEPVGQTALAPVAKFQPNPVNPVQQNPANPAVISFDTWDGSEYGVLPTVDQFPDYDWAASFNFSSGWPSMTMPPLENTGFNFG